jgi:diguanylate cyclase
MRARALRCLSERALEERIDEEVSRASRQGTALACLLVGIEDLEEIAAIHGEELSRRALAHASAALCRNLRRFDRVGCLSADELIVVLPGADRRRGEIVARRALARLRAIKIDFGGSRRDLRISVGIAAWREGQTAEQLLARMQASAPDERLGFVDALRI